MALQGNAMVWTDATHVCAIWTTWHAVVRALYGFCYGKLEALGEYVNVDSNGRILIESLLGILTLFDNHKTVLPDLQIISRFSIHRSPMLTATAQTPRSRYLNRRWNY